MGSKVWLMFMPLALAMVTDCSAAATFSKGRRYFGTDHRGLLVDKIEDIEAEMMIDSETDDRLVSLGSRYVSYASLKATTVPCNRRGLSYYNCDQGIKSKKS